MIDIFAGIQLSCSTNWLNMMGKDKDPDLTMAYNKVTGTTMRCLERCELQSEILLPTSGMYPSKEIFPFRKEFCYTFEKITRICNDPSRRKVFDVSKPG